MKAALRGRPPIAFGVWPEMIRAAHGASALAGALGTVPRNLRLVFTGRSSLTGPRAELARSFAEAHGVAVRLYIHPSVRRAYLLSAADGWFCVPAVPGGLEHKVPARRSPGEDWSGLSALEVDFASAWAGLQAAKIR